MSGPVMDFAEVEAALANANGQSAWAATLGVGSFLTVEFGAEVPSRRASGRRHGEFHLWLYCSAWRIERPGEVIASSEDPREELTKRVQILDGQVLSAIRIERPSLSCTVSFADGTQLRTFSIFTTGYEHWMFYLPDSRVFTARPGMDWSLGLD